MQIDVDVVLLGRAAPGVELHDAGNGQKPPLHHPVLDRAQIGQSEMRRTGHLIAVDFADQAGGLDLRRDVVRQADVLLQVDGGLGESEVVVDAIIERDANEREPVERGRADDVDAWRRGKANLDRDGVVALHLLGRQAGSLGGDFKDDGSRIWDRPRCSASKTRTGRRR